MGQLPVLLHVGDVAKILNVSPKTVYGWVRAQRIDVVRLPGRGIRIRPEVVAEILGMERGELLRLVTKGQE